MGNIYGIEASIIYSHAIASSGFLIITAEEQCREEESLITLIPIIDRILFQNEARDE